MNTRPIDPRHRDRELEMSWRAAARSLAANAAGGPTRRNRFAAFWGELISSSSPVGRSVKRAAFSPPLLPARMALLCAARPTYSTSRIVLPIRDELGILLNRRGLLGCGFEIGVQTGAFSETLLSRWRGRHLVSVDPWTEVNPEKYEDFANVAQEQHDRHYAQAQQRLAPFGPQSTMWRMVGDEAAERVLHHSVDFVYLDARHDRDSVLSDLSVWFDKVRPGGILAGHDYVDGVFPNGDFGVRAAVGEFFGARGLPVVSTFLDPPWLSWLVVLPMR